jgi:hypothetical protein
LSTWDPNLLEEILENLAKTANPSKTEITQADKDWAATMLEMDLQTQSGSIWSETENEKEDLMTTQQNDDEKNEEREHSLGGIVSRRTVSDKSERTLNSNSTNYEELDILISKYKGQKLTNEQVAEVVSAACFVSNNQKILLKENLKITDDLKEICNQYKSGGTAKEGRGILDEYYTDDKIVNAVRNLIKDQLQNK